MKKTVKHPSLPVTLTYDPEPHTYTDDVGAAYESVTTRVKRAFPQFDAQATAERIAVRENRLALDVLAEWRAKADSAAARGTLIHAYAESLVLGTPAPDIPSTMPEKTRQDARHAFKIVDTALCALQDAYELLGAEQMIFDPLFRLAGTIDLPARNRTTGALAILDWKTCESITDDAYGQRALPPLSHIPASKLAHYTLQLSLYAWMLTDPEYSAYPSAGEPVELALIHIPHIGDAPIWRPVPYWGQEIRAIILDDKKGP